MGLPRGDHRPALPARRHAAPRAHGRPPRAPAARGRRARAQRLPRAHPLRRAARSLQRRLSERGTSFQAIVDDARRAMAEELLAAHRATVTEAAFAVGFTDVAAFTRAFKRWNGVPPGAWSRRR
ncbi:helix-turn-helix domain-containing protein [Sorangium sp. So ce281]|uniref:helix-turn-helix domain-containing protein n=1 Tax=unclassified Sorangium TaxID=2621164 RepID=UPI003F5E8C9E